MVQAKPSLQAFTYILLGWVLLRLFMNLPTNDAREEPNVIHKIAGVTSLSVASDNRQLPKSLRSLTRAKPVQRLSTKATVRATFSKQLLHQAMKTTYKAEKALHKEEPAFSALSIPNSAAIVDQPKQQKSVPNLAVSGWLLIRSPSARQNIATAGQLGGSQLGAKVTVPLTSFGDAFYVNSFARVSTALAPVGGGEAAIGISLRHSGRLVSEIQIERRFRLSTGARSDFAVVGSTSLYDLPITPRFKLEGYAQAGAVGIKTKDLFVEGLIKADRSLFATKHSALSTGAGVWAAAQPGVHRIDIGPHVTFRQRLGPGAIRISGEWRIQVIGNARPGSGPALTAGFDF